MRRINFLILMVFLFAIIGLQGTSILPVTNSKVTGTALASINVLMIEEQFSYYPSWFYEEAEEALNNSLDVTSTVLMEYWNDVANVSAKTLVEMGANGSLGSNYDLIINLGRSLYGATNYGARINPEQTFVIIDGKASDDYENAFSYTFREQEGAFLAGALAASEFESDSIGIITDYTERRSFRKDETSWRYIGGFVAGAKYIRDTVDISIKGVREELIDENNLFEVTDVAYNYASDLYNDDTDIIFVTAGNEAIGEMAGVLQAVNETTSKSVICANGDLANYLPNHILTSVVKRVDLAIVDIIQSFRQETLKDQDWGLEEGGIDVPCPTKWLSTYNELKDKIIEGEISVPTNMRIAVSPGFELSSIFILIPVLFVVIRLNRKKRR